MIRLCSILRPSLKVLINHSVSRRNFELSGIHSFNGSFSVRKHRNPRAVASTKVTLMRIVVHGRLATAVPSLQGSKDPH